MGRQGGRRGRKEASGGQKGPKGSQLAFTWFAFTAFVAVLLLLAALKLLLQLLHLAPPGKAVHLAIAVPTSGAVASTKHIPIQRVALCIYRRLAPATRLIPE